MFNFNLLLFFFLNILLIFFLIQTDFSWDPSGRFFISAVSILDINTELGYNIWSFDGRILQKNFRDSFVSLQWRPHPPSLLSKETEKKITKEFQKYVDKYGDEDLLLQKNSRRNFYETRKKIRDDFYSWYNDSLLDLKNSQQKLRQIVSHYPEDSYQNVETLVEELISETEVKEN